MSNQCCESPWSVGNSATVFHGRCRSCKRAIVQHVMQAEGTDSIYDLEVKNFKSRGLNQSLDERNRAFWQAMAFGSEDPDSILPWKFNKWPQKDPALVRRALLWLEQEAVRRGWSTEEGPRVWYSITGPRLNELYTDKENGANLNGMFANKFGGSVSRAARFLHPDFIFIDIYYSTSPVGVIRNDEQVRLYLLEFGAERGWNQPDDWYNLESNSFDETPGRGLFAGRFADSPLSVCRWLFPNHEWMPWRLKQVGKGFWRSPREQRLFLDYVLTSEGMDSPLDLLSYSQGKNGQHEEESNSKAIEDLLADYGGGGFVQECGYVYLYDVLLVNYPDFDWKPWMFGQTKSFWSYSGNQRWFMEWMCEQIPLSISDQEILYTLTVQEIRKYGGRGLLAIMKTFQNIMETVFFEFEWVISRLRKAGSGGMYGTKKNQKRLTHFVRMLFPNREIQPDYKQGLVKASAEHTFSEERYPRIVNPKTNRELELDIFLPDIMLAYEYQGEGTHEDDDVLERDLVKENRCAELGITLIEVPHTWDSTLEYVRKLTESCGVSVEHSGFDNSPNPLDN